MNKPGFVYTIKLLQLLIKCPFKIEIIKSPTIFKPNYVYYIIQLTIKDNRQTYFSSARLVKILNDLLADDNTQ